MLENLNFADPWLCTLGLLSALSGGEDFGAGDRVGQVVGEERAAPRLPTTGQRPEVQVRVIDRPSSSTATVAWRDSTQCCYRDQVWHLSRARLTGVCVLSGRAIKRGDAIYKPRPCRPTPLNSAAMILRTVLDDAAAA